MTRVINAQPNRYGRLLLGLLPFIILLVVYIAASDARLAENANDKLLPSFAKFGDAITRMAFEPK